MIDDEQYERNLETSRKGEVNVAHALSWLDENEYIVINDIKLQEKDGKRVQQIDHLVICTKGIFNIETKS